MSFIKEDEDELKKLIGLSAFEVEVQLPTHYGAFKMELKDTRKNTGCAVSNLKRFLNSYMRTFKDRKIKILKLFRYINKIKRKKNTAIDKTLIRKLTTINKSYNTWVIKRKKDSDAW